MKKINFLIPSYNEEGNVTSFLEEANKVLIKKGYKYTFSFINDGSKDKTKEEIFNCIDKYDGVRLINLTRNYGKEAAILAGLDNSLDYDATILIDADLQMPLSYANEMIDIWSKGTLLVKSAKANRDGGIGSYLASKFYKVFNKIADSKLEQDALDFQLMDKKVVEELVKYREINRFFKGITGHIGFNSELISVEIRSRTQGSSKFSGMGRLFSYAIDSITAHSITLLNIITRIGIVVTLLSFFYGLYVIIDTLFITKNVVAGWSSLIVTLSFGFGLTILTLGIIGKYVGLIYYEVKGRPVYLVEKIYDKDNK